MVLTNCRIKYVKGWSLVAANSIISIMERTEQIALTTRRTIMVLYHDMSEQKLQKVGGEKEQRIAYIWIEYALSQTKTDIRVSMKPI